MALSDLLWACPDCGEVGAIGPEGSCTCGVVFSRGRGGHIDARYPDGAVVERTAAEWMDRLPAPEELLERAAAEGEPFRRAHVLAQEVVGSANVRGGGRFLNRIERYGPAVKGSLSLTRDSAIYETLDAGGTARTWAFEDITAVQGSSNTLQIKGRGQPLVSFRFLDDSIFLWELLLHAALRDFYRRTGRGEIVEFQPRVTTDR